MNHVWPLSIQKVLKLLSIDTSFMLLQQTIFFFLAFSLILIALPWSNARRAFHALKCSDSDWHQSMFIESMTSHCFIARKCFSSRPECGNLWYDVIGLLKLGPWWCYSLIVSFSRYIEINWSSDRIQLLIRHHWAACGAVNKLSCCKRFQLIAGVIHFRSINHYHLDAA